MSNEIELALDVEAILLDDLERTGAIDYHMPASQQRCAMPDYGHDIEFGYFLTPDAGGADATPCVIGVRVVT